MYRNSILFTAAACLILFFSGCASNSTGKTDASFDGLVPITVEGLDSAWARPGANLSAYGKIMLGDVNIQCRPVDAAGLQYDKPLTQTEYSISEEGKSRIEQMVKDTFAGEMEKSDVFALAREAGPEVLMVEISLLDVVSMIPPGRSGQASIFLDSVGEATLVLELYDSQSNAILARSMDRRAADSPEWSITSPSADNWSEVEKLVAAWATILRSELEGVKQRMSE